MREHKIIETALHSKKKKKKKAIVNFYQELNPKNTFTHEAHIDAHFLHQEVAYDTLINFTSSYWNMGWGWVREQSYRNPYVLEPELSFAVLYTASASKDKMSLSLFCVSMPAKTIKPQFYEDCGVYHKLLLLVLYSLPPHPHFPFEFNQDLNQQTILHARQRAAFLSLLKVTNCLLSTEIIAS